MERTKIAGLGIIMILLLLSSAYAFSIMDLFKGWEAQADTADSIKDARATVVTTTQNDSRSNTTTTATTGRTTAQTTTTARTTDTASTTKTVNTNGSARTTETSAQTETASSRNASERYTGYSQQMIFTDMANKGTGTGEVSQEVKKEATKKELSDEAKDAATWSTLYYGTAYGDEISSIKYAINSNGKELTYEVHVGMDTSLPRLYHPSTDIHGYTSSVRVIFDNPTDAMATYNLIKNSLYEYKTRKKDGIFSGISVEFDTHYCYGKTMTKDKKGLDEFVVWYCNVYVTPGSKDNFQANGMYTEWYNVYGWEY
jgi:hypothetical protein